jgi:amino acid permease
MPDSALELMPEDKAPSDAPEVEQGAPGEHSVRRSEWWQSSVVVTGEIMGTGVLSLPYACSRLGWVVGIGSSIGFGCTAMYAGNLLAFCKNRLYPDATSFADLATATAGPRFGKFTRGVLMTCWASILPYYLVACSQSLAAAFPDVLCYWQWCLVTMAVMAPIMQLRSFHLLSGVSALSTVAVVAVVALVVPGLVSSAPAAATSSAGIPAGLPFLHVYSALGSFVFAYQGQSVMMEIMREMKTPAEFPKALFAANGLMMLVYTSVTAVGYGTYGDAVAGFLPATLPPGALRSAVGVMLAFHTAVSYMLTAQPLHRNVHIWLFPRTADAVRGREAAVHWAGITLSFLLLAFFPEPSLNLP